MVVEARTQEQRGRVAHNAHDECAAVQQHCHGGRRAPVRRVPARNLGSAFCGLSLIGVF